jgi:hypothetical protein
MIKFSIDKDLSLKPHNTQNFDMRLCVQDITKSSKTGLPCYETYSYESPDNPNYSYKDSLTIKESKASILVTLTREMTPKKVIPGLYKKSQKLVYKVEHTNDRDPDEYLVNATFTTRTLNKVTVQKCLKMLEQ